MFCYAMSCNHHVMHLIGLLIMFTKVSYMLHELLFLNLQKVAKTLKFVSVKFCI